MTFPVSRIWVYVILVQKIEHVDNATSAVLGKIIALYERCDESALLVDYQHKKLPHQNLITSMNDKPNLLIWEIFIWIRYVWLEY